MCLAMTVTQSTVAKHYNYYPSTCYMQMLYSLDKILAQPDANQPVAWDVWMMTIRVKGHSLVICVRGRCTEVWRAFVTAPISTLLVTVVCVTGDEEAGEERGVTDQQLIRVSVVCTHAVPQSISTSITPIIVSGRYGHLGTPFEGDFLSSLVINEHYFRELQDKSEHVSINISVIDKILHRFLFEECNSFVACSVLFERPEILSLSLVILPLCLSFET